MQDKFTQLRDGFTTGSCMTAGAIAVYLQESKMVKISLPNNKLLNIPIHKLTKNSAVIIKDAGDDPDVTDKGVFTTTLEKLEEFNDSENLNNFVQSDEDLTLIITGGSGIGRVQRKGLPVEVGFYAINPMPRKILFNNLKRVNAKGIYRVTISLENGEEIAKKTLNPVLGIVGGVSILGTSGIVHPYSNAAYIMSIALQIKSCIANNQKTIAFTTGTRSTDAVHRDFPSLDEVTVIRIGDFIYSAIQAARNAGVEQLIVGCMAGKLFKYACEEKNTHAHNAKLTLAKLRDFGIEVDNALDLTQMDSMGELEAHLDRESYDKILYQVYKISQNVLQKWATSSMKITLNLYATNGDIIIDGR